MNSSSLFDRSRLRLKPLSERKSDLDVSIIKNLEPGGANYPELAKVAARIQKARDKKAAVIMIIGAHVLRSGTQRYITDMMEKGLVTLVATNGAGAIHDFELALTGKTTESVAQYISEGQFGLWEETARINDIVADGHKQNLGLGEAIGKAIEQEKMEHRDISIFAAGYRLGVPVTSHVGIGYDIIHEHPNCDGAAYGATSYADFLTFAHEVENLEGGVVMNFGSSVMGPEVFLKALSMARNVAHTENRTIRRFTTLVCDLHPIPGDFCSEPPKSQPEYYFRPFKTMLIRTVADGGESFYVQGDHSETIPRLWTILTGDASKQG
ncbi:FIG00605929: hypothetical protein [hydrothermal vent metagenome]|uniref:Arginine dihydrolase ArgZ/ArgE-like C-terminal second subdomain domain-containing protein n=1 Tax=hydrothermal vent metagenome TaxID=652676 RepID=A0A3B1C0V0_9ZZZZ